MQQLELFQPTPPQQLERTIRRKGRNIAATSILSYREEKEKGSFSAIEDGILKHLSDGRPRTRMQLAKALGKYPSSISQAVINLIEKELIHEVGVLKNPGSNKTAKCLKICESPQVKTSEP